MDFKKIGQSFASDFECALCSLGIINPQESYKNSNDEVVAPPLFKEKCRDCYPDYENLFKQYTDKKYTSDKK